MLCTQCAGEIFDMCVLMGFKKFQFMKQLTMQKIGYFCFFIILFKPMDELIRHIVLIIYEWRESITGLQLKANEEHNSKVKL